MFCKKCVLKNLTKFTGKHLCQDLFLKKAWGLQLYKKKETLVRVCKIFKNTYFYRKTPVAASDLLILLWAPVVSLSLQNICRIFSQNRIYSTMIGDNVHIYGVYCKWLLQNSFVSQKIESIHFYPCSQNKTFPQLLVITAHAEGNYAFIPDSVFWKSVHPRERRRGDVGRVETMTELEKWPKLNLWCISQKSW